MNILFLQLEEFSRKKADCLFEWLGLSDDKDQIIVLNIQCAGCHDKSRLYESVPLTYLLQERIQQFRPRLVVLDDSAFSRPLAVKLAKYANADCKISVCKANYSESGSVAMQSFVYQSNMLLHTDSSSSCVITIRADLLSDEADPHAVITEDIELVPELPESQYLSSKAETDALSSAETVFVCGAGVGSKENASMIAEVASLYGAAVGATRPVVANGWLPPECLIGISGSIIRPKLAVVFGASGSQAFMAGIENSEKIVSINHDRSASVFKNSDTALVGDCMEFAEQLRKLRR